LDGGINAKVLFLFAKPGPKTSQLGGGSGFISRNNDDPTAQAVFDLMNEAGLPRTQVKMSPAVTGPSEDDCLGGSRIPAGTTVHSTSWSRSFDFGTPITDSSCTLARCLETNTGLMGESSR
jgi:hypothetical protein